MPRTPPGFSTRITAGRGRRRAPPYVAWPPAGYVPYPVVFPQWSFALSNADFSAATVSMMSNGVPVAVTLQSYVGGYPYGGYGENTLVWYPSTLDPTSGSTVFPFNVNGSDTVYAITVSHVFIPGGSPQDFSYTVTVFDPAVPGADYVPTLVTGTNHPTVNANNPYTCTPAPDPNVTGYQWLTAQSTNGNFFDGAEAGLTNFTTTVSPGYPVVTNVTGETGSHCFHLAMPPPAAADQILQLKPVFYPKTNTTVLFKSRLGYATTNQIAKVQVSADAGSTWQDAYSQTGSNGSGESLFSARSLSLSNYAGTPVLLRFNYHFSPVGGGNFYSQTIRPYGWFFDNLTVTNTLKLINVVTNVTVSTNFIFIPAQATNYLLQAAPVSFNQFVLEPGPVLPVAAVTGPPVIILDAPGISGSQVQINFSVTAGPATTFHLLQSGSAWLGLDHQCRGRADDQCSRQRLSFHHHERPGHPVLSHSNPVSRWATIDDLNVCALTCIFRLPTVQFFTAK